MATLKLEIVTPEGVTYSEDVEMVTLPGSEGEMGIYPNHVPLMTQVAAGEVSARRNGKDEFLAVGEGFVEIESGEIAGNDAHRISVGITCQDIGLKPDGNRFCERNIVHNDP